MRFLKNAIAAAAILAAGLLAIAPAQAVGLWSPAIGDVNFPGLTGTTIDNMPIGQTTPAPVTASTLQVDNGTRTATATAGAATLNKASGIITSEALTTAAGATYTLTLTDSAIAATDIVQATVAYGTSTTGTPTIAMVKPAAGSVVIVVQNIASAAVFNGTIKIAFVDLK